MSAGAVGRIGITLSEVNGSLHYPTEALAEIFRMEDEYS